MFTKYQLAKKYLHYFFTASNGNGHGIHSPFVFDFIKNILNNKKQYQCYATIETERNKLLSNNTDIDVQDFGAGSSIIKTNKRIIKNIAQSSLKSKKYSQLLFRMIQYYQPKNIIELGTSLGITSCYLAKGNSLATLYTCEGAKSIAAIANKTFNTLDIKNIQLIVGNFDITLPPLLSQIQSIDFAFVDGNHQKKSTLNYFGQLLNFSNPNTILVFDDIHWSNSMEDAWAQIKQHPQVTLSIDLFFIGIVCINSSIKQKQNFVIRF